MAFNNSSAARNNAPRGEARDESWKAQGFLNLYLPDAKSGKDRKLGAIPLRESKPSEKNLLAWLNENPERVAIIMSKLKITYQSVDSSNDAGFALEDSIPS
jgi:hypothetical protein